ncbi:MAG TPA: SOS response-associated peptidase family protein [Lacipirellulaceae bacterium]|nr:SOS response-associated peptidase family protein [Lacipirellulaceae bacterium]
MPKLTQHLVKQCHLDRLPRRSLATYAKKPSFRDAFDKRRCILPANESGVFALAGLWEGWRDRTKEDAAWVRTFAIITGKPNSVMAPIHDRMPVILAEEDWAKWLGEEPATGDELQRMIAEPYSSQLMRAYPVSARVNSVRNDEPGPLEPMDASGGIRV